MKTTVLHQVAPTPIRAGHGPRTALAGLGALLEGVGEELVERVADRVVERLAERVSAPSSSPSGPVLEDRERLALKLDVSVSAIDRLRRDGMPTIWVTDLCPRFELGAVVEWLRGRGAK